MTRRLGAEFDGDAIKALRSSAEVLLLSPPDGRFPRFSFGCGLCTKRALGAARGDRGGVAVRAVRWRLAAGWSGRSSSDRSLSSSLPSLSARLLRPPARRVLPPA